MSKANNNLENKINTYLKDKTDKIKKIINPNQTYRIDFIKSGKNKLMGLYSKNKLIIAGNYNFYGVYQPYRKLWVWASSIPGVDVRHIKNVDKIRSFSHLFESESNPKIAFYYQLLTQDVIVVEDEKILDWINEVLLYLSGDMYYFNPSNSDGNVQFLTLVDIKEKYI